MEMRVLAIDDSPTVLELLSEVLSSRGYEVETAASGKEGLAKYATFKPEIVTLDLAMPSMDGYETLSSLKSMDKYANVIMLSAANHSSALQRCLSKGAIDFVSKPFGAIEILNAIQRAMKSHKYCRHDTATFFSRLEKKLEYVSSISLSRDASLELKSVQTVRDASANGKIHGESQSSHYQPCDDDICFVTRITGDKDGIIASLIKSRDLNPLFNTEYVEGGKLPENVVEFFNMINMKVVSDLAESTHSNIDGQAVVSLMHPKRMTDFWYETARMWNRIELGLFEIDRADYKIPLTIQIWYDGELFA